MFTVLQNHKLNLFYWGIDQLSAFEEIKKEMSSEPVLCAFDLTRRHWVPGNSSRIASGAVLWQFTEVRYWQCVEYASRKLLRAEIEHTAACMPLHNTQVFS